MELLGEVVSSKREQQHIINRDVKTYASSGQRLTLPALHAVSSDEERIVWLHELAAGGHPLSHLAESIPNFPNRCWFMFWEVFDLQRGDKILPVP